MHKARVRFGYEGSPVYASIDSLKDYNMSRKDDLECLGYTIMNMINTKRIPWKNLNHKIDIL